MIVKKIISGGQTGVDIAATDTAIELGMDWGELIPKGRRQEMGRTVPISYDRFTEHASSEWLPRTYANVDAAGAALILSDTWPPDGGDRPNAPVRVADRWYPDKGAGRVMEKTKRRLRVNFDGLPSVWYDAPHAAQFLEVRR